MIFTTNSGIRFCLEKDLKEEWNPYDCLMATAHLHNYGHIIVDAEHGDPIDNEGDLQEIEDFLQEEGCGCRGKM